MYQPTRFPLSVGNARSDLKPPPVIGFGLEEIVAMIAANDAFEYQEGQVFFGLDCTLYLETFFPTVGTRGSACKWYTNGMYTYDEGEYSTITDMGQGYIYGRPYA